MPAFSKVLFAAAALAIVFAAPDVTEEPLQQAAVPDADEVGPITTGNGPHFDVEGSKPGSRGRRGTPLPKADPEKLLEFLAKAAGEKTGHLKPFQAEYLTEQIAAHPTVADALLNKLFSQTPPSNENLKKLANYVKNQVYPQVAADTGKHTYTPGSDPKAKAIMKSALRITIADGLTRYANVDAMIADTQRRMNKPVKHDIFNNIERRDENGRAYQKPRFELVKQKPGYDIRSYSPLSVAATPTNGNSLFPPMLLPGDRPRKGDEGFKSFYRLASYIFGANSRKENMGMTIPVGIVFSHKDTKAGEKPTVNPCSEKFTGVGRDDSMVFVMPNKYWKNAEAAPKPVNEAVKLHKISSQRLAVGYFTGVPNKENVENARKALCAALKADGVRALGARYSVLVYNDPLTMPHLRRNEVVVSVGTGAKKRSEADIAVDAEAVPLDDAEDSETDGAKKIDEGSGFDDLEVTPAQMKAAEKDDTVTDAEVPEGEKEIIAANDDESGKNVRES